MTMSQAKGAGSTSEQLGGANQFNITGPIVISYSKTSFGGVPLFSYKDAELDLNFSGDDITRQDTPLGEIVTITLENLVPVDGPLRTFTLLVPTIRLSMGDQVSFDTLGIETIDSSAGFAPPTPSSLLTYRSHQLQGVAVLVNF
ncbi:MAG: hypothetical protein ACRDTG_10370 [Pseudonocardiaceae bacterium]